MRKKSLSTWIRENREEIDEAVKRMFPGAHLNDKERREWVLNDEGLYLWARHDGVDV